MNPESCQVTLQGAFDRPAALRLEEAVRDLHAGARVDVDLRQVSGFQDCNVALLARALETGRRELTVRVRGLQIHHLRLLRYLGVEVELAAPDQEPN